MINIPINTDISSSLKQRIELDGILFNLKIYWNTMNDAWFMDIYQNDTLVFAGLKLVKEIRLLNEYAIEEIPGDFILYDTENLTDGLRVDFDNLGTRYLLIYLTEDEL